MLCCTAIAELDPKAIKKGHVLTTPHHANITAFLYYHLVFLSSQQLFLPSFSQVGYTAPINIQSCGFNLGEITQEKLSANEDESMLQLKVTSYMVFTEVFRVLLKVTWKAWEPQPSNHSFLFYFQVPWCDPDLTKLPGFIFFTSHTCSPESEK